MALDTQDQRTGVYKRLFLKGVKVAIMTGDSIASNFATVSNKSNLLYRSDSGQYLLNQATGGSDIAYYDGLDDDTWNPFSFIGKSAADAVNRFVIRNCDYLIVWAGFNDLDDEVPLGAIDSVDSFTIAGAIRNGVANYLSRKPDLQIIFITPTANPYQVANGIGVTLNDIRNQVIAVCADLGIPCYDLYAVCGITDENKATALPDQIHPTAAFHETWAPMIVDFVEANII
jgi:hypothetical protein